MAVTASPIADLRSQLEEAVSQPGLTPAERVAKLRSLHESIAELLGQAESYIGDVELLREAEYLSVAESVLLVRQNASIRDELVRRGIAQPGELDEAGYLSHAELDRLSEEGRLIESVEGIVRHIGSYPLEEAFGLPIHFDPKLHPRDRVGKFSKILGGLAHGQEAHMPSGVRVRRESGGFTVHGHGGQRESVGSESQAAKRAITHHDMSSAGGFVAGQGKIHLPPKGRKGGTTPSVLHTHPPDAVAGGTPGAPPGTPGEPGAPGEGGHDVVVTDDVEEAVRALAAGKHVELHQPEQVSTLISKLHEYVQEMEKKGEKAENLDLCRVTLKGTSLFCIEGKGIPRAQMPQLLGVPEPGSKADQLPRTSRGEVDLTQHFIAHLVEKGVKIERTRMLVSHMKATQNELNGAKVAGIMNFLKQGGPGGTAGTIESPPYLLGREGYIVDGHHRWAAEIGMDFSDGKPDWETAVDKIDLDIISLLQESNSFAAEWGIPQAGFSQGFAEADMVVLWKLGLGIPFDEDETRLIEALFADEGIEVEDGQLREALTSYVDRLHPRDRRGRWRRVFRTLATKVGVLHDKTARSDAPDWEPAFGQVHWPGKHDEAWHLTPGVEPTQERVQADLEKAQRIGLNKWPKPGPLALEILGRTKDTQELHTRGWLDPEDAPASLPYEPTEAPDKTMKVPVYTAERRVLHDKIIDVLLRERKKVVDREGKTSYVLCPDCAYAKSIGVGQPVALFMGGGTASGKTTALGRDENKDLRMEHFVIIDPDEIKALLPEYADMVEGGEKYAASAVHEESSDIGKRLQREAMERGLDVVVDGTGDSVMKEAGDKAKVVSKMARFNGDGEVNQYGGPSYQIHIFYVSAATDVAFIRSVMRAQRSGRWVPEPEVRNIHKGVSQRWIREVLPAIESGMIVSARGYDTTGAEAVRMFDLPAPHKLRVLDEETYQAFLAKADEPKHSFD